MKSRTIRRGFTLVELLVVIAIIMVLAALTFVAAPAIIDGQKRRKATLQIRLIENALEKYKLENGNYPTSGLPATAPLKTANGKDGQSNVLYTALYWDTNANGVGAELDTTQRAYLGELDPASNKQGWIKLPASKNKAEASIVDPWGHEYRYRSGQLADGSTNTTAHNPDFDLWSCGPDGLTKDDGTDGAETSDDLRNFGKNR